ncbi:protein of unknown function [Xenorhabdus poinarii G6]|uniref:Uncharacterized protein n=1 Tax=Xenorhabdus poinarii G6 TaxID=1354304 RepID=A0A068R8Q5_9GAMM|nr:protein of unknown function [Xenorhabdus poinarii G6]
METINPYLFARYLSSPFTLLLSHDEKTITSFICLACAALRKLAIFDYQHQTAAQPNIFL